MDPAFDVRYSARSQPFDQSSEAEFRANSAFVLRIFSAGWLMFFTLAGVWLLTARDDAA